MIIIGAGLSGCLAGVMMPQARIYEAAEDVAHLTQHRAVLRFRTDRVAQALGIPFQRVTVYKSIFDHGAHYGGCTPAQHNEYARKVVGRLVPRSIVDLATVERWVGPSDLHAQLLALCGARVRFGCPVTQLSAEAMAIAYERGEVVSRGDHPVISTMPLQHLLRVIHPAFPNGPALHRAEIYTHRYRVPGCGMHQTVYFPDPGTPLYRATLTGEDLILEAMRPMGAQDHELAFMAFGLTPCRDVEAVEEGKMQQFGKIVELPADVRKALLLNITLTANVYSLGRFACYRNSLLDDVYQDIFRIREMIRMGHYDLRKAAAR